MKITSLELFTVPPRWLFLKISTDEGIAGWGEPVVEGHASTVAEAVREIGHYLIGADPNHIEDIWQTLYRGRFYRGGPVLMSAIAGVNQALWDIKGKWLGVPVYDLLGGKVRDKILVYSWIGGDRPADVANAAKEKQEQGFHAIKMLATDGQGYIASPDAVDAVVQRIASVREAVGNTLGIGVDFHGRLHKAMAKVIARELEPYHLMFIEEPVLPENNDALREVAQHTTIPIATGERMYSRWDFKQLLEAGYVDIIQPDVSHAGGISETLRIANMAEAYDVALAPHCPLGPIALAACLQIDAIAHNAFIQEQSLGLHYNVSNDLLDYLKDSTVFAFEDGYIKTLEGPGLGIQVNESYVEAKNKEGHNWRNPLWRIEDYSVAEW